MSDKTTIKTVERFRSKTCGEGLCESNAFKIKIRQLEADNTILQKINATSIDEIAELKANINLLVKALNDANNYLDIKEPEFTKLINKHLNKCAASNASK